MSFIWVFVSAKPDNSATKLPGEDINIKIHGTSASIINGEFSLDIHKSNIYIKIVSSVLDSFRFSEMRVDTEAIHIAKQHQQLNISEPGIFHPFPKRYTEILEKYKVFTRDSVLLETKNYPAYCELLDRVITTSAEVLENKERNKNRIVLDGAWITYEINVMSAKKTVRAHSPDVKSNPLLCELLNSSEKLYHDNKGKDKDSKK